MNTRYHRKKQPALVRQQLLDIAAEVVSEGGLHGLTLDAVAGRAGVSKGGLLHHFPSKQALLEGVCDALLEQTEAALWEIMEKDPHRTGRFSRAYLELLTVYSEGEEAKRAGALHAALLGDVVIRQRFSEWFETRVKQYEATNSSISAWIVRLATDGLWLSDLITGQELHGHRRPELLKVLKKMTFLDR